MRRAAARAPPSSGIARRPVPRPSRRARSTHRSSRRIVAPRAARSCRAPCSEGPPPRKQRR
eukprot:1036356-Prymnesium_polylepis.1